VSLNAAAVVVGLIGLVAMAVGLYFLVVALIRLVRHQSGPAFDAAVLALVLVVVAHVSMDVWRTLVAR
jgi:hypothetical protein